MNDSRLCGYSESICSNPLVIKQLWLHLDNISGSILPEETSMYE